MSKNVNKLVAIITVGAVLSVPMISNAKNVVRTEETTVTTSTPSEKELTKSDFKPSMYYVGGTLFTIADVDDFVNPKYFWDSRYGVTDNIKNFENVNEYNGHSSDLDNYVPEGYIFKGWKVRGYNEEYEVTEVDAILEKDQDFIDKMETSLTVNVNDSKSIDVKYDDKTSSSKLTCIKYSIEGLDSTYNEFSEVHSGEEYENCFISYVYFNKSIATTNSCTFYRRSDLSAVGTKFNLKVEAINDLGKVTTFEKVYNKEDLFSSEDVIRTIDSNVKLDSSNLPYVEIPNEVYYGDRIYIYNLPDEIKEDSLALRQNGIKHDETGYYFDIDKSFLDTCDVENYYNKHVELGDFDPATFSSYYELRISFFYFTRALKVHNISRDGKSVAFGELPKQEEPEVPVEPATKTPEEPETPVEPATKTPEEVKPAEPATKTPEETKPAKPSNTSDASNVAVALVGLTLAGAVVAKTKKNA